MSPLTKSNNLAARMGRWSAGHWKTAVFGWLAFVIAALAIGMQVGTKQIDQQNANVGQSHRADNILRDAGFEADPQTEIVLVQSKTLTAHSPEFRAVVGDVVSTVTPFTTKLPLESAVGVAIVVQLLLKPHWLSVTMEFGLKSKPLIVG